MKKAELKKWTTKELLLEQAYLQTVSKLNQATRSQKADLKSIQRELQARG